MGAAGELLLLTRFRQYAIIVVRSKIIACPRFYVTLSFFIIFLDDSFNVVHHAGTEGSVSRLDFVDACGGGDVVPSPVSRTRTSNNSIGTTLYFHFSYIFSL